jgi:hypothetical protein
VKLVVLDGGADDEEVAGAAAPPSSPPRAICHAARVATATTAAPASANRR